MDGLTLTALDDLNAAEHALPECLIAQADARNAARTARLQLDAAKRALDEALVRGTAQAMFGDGAVVDGKNAEARKAQLDLFLIQFSPASMARREVERAESELEQADAQVELAEANARATLMAAAMAQQRAELLAAYYRMLAAPAGKSELAPVHQQILYR